MNSNRLKQIFKLVKNELINGNTIYNPRTFKGFTLLFLGKREKAYHNKGICSVISHLQDLGYFKVSEYAEVHNYLGANRPKIDNEYSDFTKSEYWTNNSYWWIPMEFEPQTKQVRIDYLTALIDNIK